MLYLKKRKRGIENKAKTEKLGGVVAWGHIGVKAHRSRFKSKIAWGNDEKEDVRNQTNTHSNINDVK